MGRIGRAELEGELEVLVDSGIGVELGMALGRPGGRDRPAEAGELDDVVGLEDAAIGEAGQWLEKAKTLSGWVPPAAAVAICC